MPKRKLPEPEKIGTRSRVRRQCEAEPELQPDVPVPAPVVDVTEAGEQSTIIDDLDDGASAGDEIHEITPIISVYSQLGDNVSEATRQRIIEGKFVNLGNLLRKGPQEVDEHRILIKNGQLVSKSLSVEKIFSIERWTDAFLVFIAIYGTAHPAKVPGLLKYMDSVRLGAKRCHGLGWKSYDEQYRLRKSNNPESDWAKIDDELWLLCMNDRFAVSQSRFQPQYNAKSSGKCFDFNNKGSCFRYPCNYLHTCLKCSGDHPLVMCTMTPMHNQAFHSPRSSTSFQQPGLSHSSFQTPRPSTGFQAPHRFTHPGNTPRAPFKSTRGRGRGQGFMGSSPYTNQN